MFGIGGQELSILAVIVVISVMFFFPKAFRKIKGPEGSKWRLRMLLIGLFGILSQLVSIAHSESTSCQMGSEADIKPKSAIFARFVERDARLFVEAVEPGVDTTLFDTVVILMGPDVFGGTVAVVFKDGCFVGRKFLSGLDFIYATRMFTLFRTNPALLHTDRLEMVTLKSMADAGEPSAQFHMGLAYAWGRGVSPDRSASIEWLKRAAEHGFSPAMLALGMALSGPGVILDEAQEVGKPPRMDEFTDLVRAYFWLEAASRSSERDVKNEASYHFRELSRRMPPEELQKAKDLAKKRKEPPRQ